MTSSSSARAAADLSWPRSSPHAVSTCCCSRPAPPSSTASASGLTSRTRRTIRRPASSGSAPATARKPPWARDLPQNCFLWQTAGVGGSDGALLRQLAARDAGSLLGLRRGRRRRLRPGTCRAVRLPRAHPVLRMGGAHPAGADGRDGDEGGAISHGRGQARAAAPDVQGHHRCRLPPAGERDPPAAGHGRADERPQEAHVPGGEGLHVLRPLPAGLHRAA